MRLDLHIHTTYGSACSRLRPEQLMRVAGDRGLDGICITEHDFMWPEHKVKELASPAGLVVLRGMEVSTEVGHVLVYGLPGYLGGICYFDQLQQAAERFQAALVLAHPLRGYFLEATKVEKKELNLVTIASDPVWSRVAAIEVYNASAGAQETSLAREAARRAGRPMVGGSDAHSPDDVGWCVTDFPVAVRNEAELADLIRSGSYTAVDLR